MENFKLLILLVVIAVALAERQVLRPRLKRGARASRLTKIWRQDRGVGSFKEAGTAGGNALAKSLRSSPCTHEGFIPEPGSCTSFIRCVDYLGTGKYFSVFRFNCPFGTVFDDDLDICNHPGSVSNPPECAGAAASLPLPEPPGVDTATASEGIGTTSEPIDGVTDDTEPCNGTLAPYPQPQTTTVQDIEETTFPLFLDTTTVGQMWQVDETSIYQCPAPGYYPFEGDCIRFYKCVETDSGKLKGLLYKCPTGYGYSEEKKRCWPESQLQPCERRSSTPAERLDTATPLYPDDLLWFFNNKKK